MTKSKIEVSNLDEYLEFSLSFASNLPKIWGDSDYTQRQLIQNVLFPGGITYNRLKDECRTIEVNNFISEIAALTGDLSILAADKTEKTAFTPLSSW